MKPPSLVLPHLKQYRKTAVTLVSHGPVLWVFLPVTETSKFSLTPPEAVQKHCCNTGITPTGTVSVSSGRCSLQMWSYPIQSSTETLLQHWYHIDLNLLVFFLLSFFFLNWHHRHYQTLSGWAERVKTKTDKHQSHMYMKTDNKTPAQWPFSIPT